MSRLALPSTLLHRTSSSFGMLWAALALWVQLVSGSVAMPNAMPDAFADALTATICHAETDQNTPPAHHHAPDCALCPICQVVAHAHALLLPPVAVVASPLALALAVFATPSAQTGPGIAATPPRARAPPTTL